MSTAPTDTSAAASALMPSADVMMALLGHLQVELGVDLGVVRLSLGDLMDLTPGTRLHVDRQGRTDVSLTIQGQPLLAGALLERDRRLAVRLVPNRTGE